MAISIADYSCSPTRPLGLFAGPEKTIPRTKQSMWHRFGLRKWLGRDDRDSRQSPPGDSNLNNDDDNNNRAKPHGNLTRRLSRKVGVGLPRATTFKRQNSERRDRLIPFEPEPRAVSADRRRTLSIQRTRSPQPNVGHRLSAPEVQWFDKSVDTTVEEPPETNDDSEIHSEWSPYPEDTDTPERTPEDIIDLELEKKWILNLSMHFRDGSLREKFFVTYAETPTRWRRVTISCDYSNTVPDSLEQDLKELRYQRDKCARIYESMRDSLPAIQFYDTVTNLRLETLDGRLHVHVTEDVNEIIPYPPISCVGHLYDARFIPENALHFDAHLSGFVYNVRLDEKSFIKKEIPGPDTVDEFLYEINALHALNGSQYVIQVEGIIVDDRREVVKGLLISYAEQGALVDILYEQMGEISWRRRERWAEQIVHGLCDIHEAGYVQGDFTLSNIVVDANNNAKIIDINRRGCPVGWEPPEIAAKIESNQRISMYIGVKTDLFQLGMTLWALAMQDDEPERQDRPLVLQEDVKVPEYYRRLVAICMSPTPRHRLSAKELLAFFPKEVIPSHHLPSVREIGGSLKPDNDMLSLQSFPSVSASLPKSTPDGFADHMNPLSLPPSNLDGDYSLSQYETSLTPAPPYVERNSYAPLLDGDSKARVVELAELADGSEINGLPPDDDQLGQPPLGNPNERVLRNSEHYWQHNEVAACSSKIKESGDFERMAFEESAVNSSANLHHLNKDPTAGQKQHLSPLSMQDLLKDTTAVGAHTANPLIHEFTPIDSVQHHESPLTSSTAQSTDLSPTPVAEGPTYAPDRERTYTHSAEQAQSHSVISLFHSILPINPALKMSNHEPPPTSSHQSLADWTIDSTVDHPPPELQEHIARLSDSKLPINPAFIENSPPPV